MTQQALGPRLPGDFELIALARSGDTHAAAALIGRHIGAVASLGTRPHSAAHLTSSPDTDWLRGAAQDGLPVRAAILARHSRGGFECRPSSSDPLWLAFASLPAVWRTALWHREVEGQRPGRIGIYLGMGAPDATRALLAAYAGLLRAIAVNHTDPEDATCAWVYEEFRFSPPPGLDRTHSKLLSSHAKSCSSCASLASALLRSRTELRRVLAETALGAAAPEYLASRPLPPKLPSDTSSPRQGTRAHKVLSPAFAIGLVAAMALVVVTSPSERAATRTQTPPSVDRLQLVTPGSDLTPTMGAFTSRIAIHAVEAQRTTRRSMRAANGEAGQDQSAANDDAGSGDPNAPVAEPPPSGHEEPTPTEPGPKPEPPADPPPVDVDTGGDGVVIVVDPGPVVDEPVVIEVPIPEVPSDPLNLP